jgi:pyrroloquinoline quinone (PQQ) biosynthesis protein C
MSRKNSPDYISKRSKRQQHEHIQHMIKPHCSHGQLRNLGIEVYFIGSKMIGKGSFAQHVDPVSGL